MQDASQLAMTKEKRIHATTWSQTSLKIDDSEQVPPDPKLLTDSKDEMKAWGYLMTQYSTSCCYEVMTNSLMKKGIMGLIPFIKFTTQYNSIKLNLSLDTNNKRVPFF
jgi:hypothetical protein